jgi:nucleotidyltransferase/DNA polymerase involved in DNA repair
MAMIEDVHFGPLSDFMDPISHFHFREPCNPPSPEELAFETLSADQIICNIDARRSYTLTWMTLNLESVCVHIEMHLHPELGDLPFVICDRMNQGIISDASTTAKSNGILPGMTLLAALTLAPDLIPIVADPAKYGTFRLSFEAIVSAFDPNFCFSGLRHLTLNLTSFCNENSSDLFAIAQEIRARFLQCLAFPLKIGIANSCTASKIAAALEDAISIAPPAKLPFLAFLGSAPIEAVPGLSPSKLDRLHALGITSIGQVIENRALISFHFRKSFVYLLFSAALGIDNFIPIRPIETTFPATSDFTEISGRLRVMCEKLSRRISRSGRSAKYLKVSFIPADGKMVTKSMQFQYSSMEFCDLYTAAYTILQGEESLSILTGAKIAVSERPFVKHTTQPTLGKWAVGGVAGQPKSVKGKKTALEDFWAMKADSQELPRIRPPKKKFRPRSTPSAPDRDHLTQRTLI